MTVARNRQINLDVTRYYHCYSECVRGASLCGGKYEHRKQWLEDRIQFLSGVFAVDTCSFAVLDNHFHALVRINSTEAEAWSDEEVVRRWARISPPKDKKGNALEPTLEWVRQQVEDAAEVAEARERLVSLSWFMKYLKEPLSRMANKEDGTRGHFWADRFKSIPVIGEEILLITTVSIDLSLLAAGISASPELGPHTSLRARVQHLRDQGSARHVTISLSDPGPEGAAAEQLHWLCPIEDRRAEGAEREGMLKDVGIGSYLEVVEWSSRLYRGGPARVSPKVAAVLERLGTTPERWLALLRAVARRRIFLPRVPAPPDQTEAGTAEQAGSH